MLTSGRRIGVDPHKLFQLFKDAAQGQWVHRLMAISGGDALYRFLEVIELLPDAGDGEVSVSLNQSSQPLPGRFLAKPTGVFAHKLEDLSPSWSSGEIEELRDFLREPRTKELCTKLLHEVCRQQELLLSSGSNSTARLLALYWKEGCHPAQEENWSDEEFW